MKKELVILSSLCLLLFLPFSIAYETNFTIPSSVKQNLAVTSYNLEPYPVEPGEVVTLYAMIKNLDNSPVGVSCKIAEQAPFSVYSVRSDSINDLGGGQSWRMEFEIKVDPLAIEGTSNLELQCSSSRIQDVWITTIIPVAIRQRYALLHLENLTSTPDVIAPGNSGSFSFDLVNNDESIIRDAYISLDMQSTPIAPDKGVSVQKLSGIAKDSPQHMVFNFLVLPDAKPGVYRVPAIINYTDSEGIKQGFSSLLTLKVSETPQYIVLVDSATKKSKGVYDLTLKFINTGKSNLALMHATLGQSANFAIEGPEQFYIGSLDSDDYATQTITAKVTGDSISIPLTINYRDPLNKIYEDKMQVLVTISQVLKTQQGGSNTWLYIFIVIVVLAGYWFYKNRENRKRRMTRIN